jgi:hypothetical protein
MSLATSAPLTRAPITGLVALAAASLLTACQAAKAPDVAAAPVSSVPMGTGGGTRGFGLEVTKRTDGVETTVAASRAAVFTALEAVFAGLPLPLTVRDAAAGTIGNEGYKFRRKLGDMPSRKLLDCGGSSGMPNAETYTIKMSVLTNVTDAGTGSTTLTTVVVASAENPNYPGSGVSCSSTGALEARIAGDLRTRLNATPR